MKPCIVLDGLPLQVQSAGIAVYTEALVRQMAAARPGAEFVLYGLPEAAVRALSARGSNDGPNAAARSGPPLPPNVSWVRSLAYPFVMGYPIDFLPRALPLVLRGRRPAVFHGTNYAAPLAFGTAVVVTVHDLALLRFPELGTPRLRRFVGRAGARLRGARRIIADSAATAADVSELLGVPSDRIRVVYPGCDRRFRPLPRDEARRTVAGALGIAPPYILHVGTLEPRKNIERLLAAFAEVRRARRLPHTLVCAGAPGWGAESVRRQLAALDLGNAARLTGAVPADLLPALYAGADGFVFPSLYEGFGLPVVEAMACGTPVVTSDNASLPEVAGDAALLVDPHDVGAIAAAIDRVVHDTALRATLRERGLARAETFTWERCARKTLAVYEEVTDASA